MAEESDGAPAVKRSDFQDLARLRLKEARVLLKNGQYAGAYYLSGYVVECALKACIARRTERYEFPPKRNVVDRCYTHVLPQLLETAGLTAARNTEAAVSASFEASWNIVRDWTEEARYNAMVSKAEAEQMLAAVAATRGGVLRWLRRYW
jgi:HEPN domain-containing protein